jgi:hypothetical protein
VSSFPFGFNLSHGLFFGSLASLGGDCCSVGYHLFHVLKFYIRK